MYLNAITEHSYITRTISLDESMGERRPGARDGMASETQCHS